ncbi:MAG: hypothetical protein V4531_02075 [Actinomycetota bacterium]
MDPNYLPVIAGAGMLALVLWIILAVIGFVASALIATVESPASASRCRTRSPRASSSSTA